VLLGVAVRTSPGQQSSSTAQDEPFLEEWVYKVKWGHNEEFFEILKKNQLAIPEREKQLGYVTQYTVYAPGLHTSEDQRWDYRVFIVFKNQGAAKHEREVARQLFPDQQTFKKEENHRWDLTEAHWICPYGSSIRMAVSERPAMKMIRLLTYLLFAALLPNTLSATTGSIDGQWDATVNVGGAEIPFRFEIQGDGSNVAGSFFEGDKRISSTSGTFGDGLLHLDYEFLNSTLTAKLEGDALSGSYRYNRKNGREYAFRAVRSTDSEAKFTAGPKIAGNWEKKLVGEDHSGAKDSRVSLSWKLFLRESGTAVSGSILRVDGDTGTLTGGWRGDTLILSHFAGERPVLVEAKLQADGTMDILYNNLNRYLAARTPDARAKGIAAPPDPSNYTGVTNATEPFRFKFPDVNGKVYSSDDAQFKNKIVILAIGGTWCPNCRDEAPFLVELYRKYHTKGLEIVGLNFEAAGDLVEDNPRIESFIKEFSIPYPILYAGAIPDAKEKLPQIANFGAYPTTIYLERDGRVASIHAGFASAATGEANSSLQHEVKELVERLLDEKSKQQVYARETIPSP
jgi:Thiol-disulfide isomerase and thioredoxins